MRITMKLEKEIPGYFLISLVLLSAFGLDISDGGFLKCHEGQYFDLNDSKCKMCSTCGENKIIRKPCNNMEDTICGPFLEFNEFLQKSEKKNETNIIAETLPTVTKSVSSRKDLAAVSSGEDQWKTLSMALIAVLSIVMTFLVICIFVVCYLRNKSAILQKNNEMYDSDTFQPSDTYVQIQPHMLLNSQPTGHKIYGMNERVVEYGSYSDEYPFPVQEASCSRLLVPGFVTGTPNRDEEDVDSGASSIKSEYVYFNCPQNGNNVVVNPV